MENTLLNWCAINKYIISLVQGLLLVLGLVTPVALAHAERFVVRDIRIEGLKGLRRDTVLSYLPIHPGQTFDAAHSASLIQSLYATGFFSDIQVIRQADSLLIKLVERPVLANIVVNGNKQLPKDKLDEVIKNLGLIPGQIFDPTILDKLKKFLSIQYDSLGKYSAQVITRVLPQPRNRVSVQIDISEGLTVQLANIHIIGNRAFSESQLSAALPMAPSRGLFSLFTPRDEYNRTKLEATIEALRNYYLDRGYLRFKVDSTQVSLTPDRRHAYLMIRVSEGPQYTISGYRLTGPRLLDKTALQRAILIKQNALFSRQMVLATEQAFKQVLDKIGYAQASVTTVTDIDDVHKTVFVSFYIDPGHPIYVRRINISGNFKTQDEVVRRLLRQYEASPLSMSAVQMSIHQLNLSGLLNTEPSITTTPVPDQPDLVDLNVLWTEKTSFQTFFSLGYGTGGGFASIFLGQPNVFGIGRDLAITLEKNRLSSSYSLSYVDPYYTLDGVRRSIEIAYTKWHTDRWQANKGQVDPKVTEKSQQTAYSLNTYSANMSYAIPFNAQGDFLQLGAGLRRLEVNLPPLSSQADEIRAFVERYGSRFNQMSLTMGWNRNGWDRRLFPTQGLNQGAGLQLILPLGGKSLSYYKASYQGAGYVPLGHGFILEGHLNLAYGTNFHGGQGLPFFENYYAGGVGYNGQVRGYDFYTLGPRDSQGGALGGNILATGGVSVILPQPLSNDSVRTGLFLDGGNVYSSVGVTQPGHPKGGTLAGPLRYSAGIAVDWQIPIFNIILKFSLAKPINPQPRDEVQTFQFSMGTGF